MPFKLSPPTQWWVLAESCWLPETHRGMEGWMKRSQENSNRVCQSCFTTDSKAMGTTNHGISTSKSMSWSISSFYILVSFLLLWQNTKSHFETERVICLTTLVHSPSLREVKIRTHDRNLKRKPWRSFSSPSSGFSFSSQDYLPRDGIPHSRSP